jgi:hypothetical protein
LEAKANQEKQHEANDIKQPFFGSGRAHDNIIGTQMEKYYFRHRIFY